MLKFLLYLFIIYFVVRFIFGRILGVNVRSRVIHFNTHHHYHKNEEPDQEGNIKINNTGSGKKPKGNGKQLGEYVDYEEVK